MDMDTSMAKRENTSLGTSVPNEVSVLERTILKLINILEKITYPINNWAHRIAMLVLFLLMLLTTADVVGRSFFNKPVTGTYELTGLMLAVLIFFSLGKTQIEKDHIEIDFLTNKFPLKVREGLRAVFDCILMIVLGLMTWQLYEYTNRTMLSQEVSGELDIPLYIFILLCAVGAFCFTLTILLDFLRSVFKVVKKNES